MKLSTIIAILVIILVVVGGIMLFKNQSDSAGTSGESALTASEAQALDNEADSIDTAGLSDSSMDDLAS